MVQETYSLFLHQVRHILYEVLLHLVGAICLIGGIPYVILLLISSLLFRPLVKLISILFRPDLTELLPSSDSIITQLDDPDHVKNCIVIQLTLSGALDPSEFIRIFQDRVLENKYPNGDLRYHEFREFPTSFLGFMFWKWEDNFDFNEHIRVYTEDQPGFPEGPEGLEAIGKRLLCGPFQPFKSPWDWTLIINKLGGDPKTTIFFRIHHGIADGYSILYMFQRLFGSKRPGAPAFSQKVPSVGLKYILSFPVATMRIVGELVCNSVTGYLWKINQGKKSRVFNYRIGKVLSVRDLKRIKNKFGVNFSAVVFSLLGGGMHRFMRSKGMESSPWRMMPSMIPVPMAGHGDTFENHFSFALTNILVGEPDPVKRLMVMQKEFNWLRHSPLPLIGSWIVKFHGSQINGIGRLINKFKYAPLITTYFPVGDRSDWSLAGCQAVNYSFFIRMVPGDAGGTFCISSYNDGLQVTPVFNDNVLSQKEVDQLSNEIDNEVEELLKFVDDYEV